jgi:putative alpha-1,2-mannosidase
VKNGRTFTITATNNSAANKYIQRTLLNGQPYELYYILFKDIEQGGTLEFVMGDTPKQ